MKLILLFSIFIPLIIVANGSASQPQAIDQTLPLCSQSIHDSYKTTGPDGRSYLTWHPQIDFNNHCYFDHEHGSNLATLWPNGPKPLYGYTMPEESHSGFKTYVIDLDRTHRAMITHHFGTANAVKAVCTRFHTFDLVIIDSVYGEVLANVHMMGDFGKPVVNETGELIKNPCVDPAIGSNGVRQFPISNLRNVGYEPWRLHRDHSIDYNPKANAFGFDSGAIIFNTRNPKTACDNITCTLAIQRTDPSFYTQSNGTVRTVEIPYHTFGFTGAVSGTFVVDGLIQYIKPNWSFRQSPPNRCWPIGTSYVYDCHNIEIDTASLYRNFFITGNN